MTATFPDTDQRRYFALAAPRVLRGAALLDEREPGWADKIVLDNLEMDDAQMCVLGQTNGDYWSHAARLGLATTTGYVDESAVEHGFNINHGDIESFIESFIYLDFVRDRHIQMLYSVLAGLWVEQIKARQAVGPIGAFGDVSHFEPPGSDL